MKKMKWIKKGISALLALNMVLSSVPLSVFAVTEDNLCDHHTAHTADCGYVEAVAGVACGHEHSEDCYAIVQCIHEHDESCGTDGVDCTHECTVDNGCITMALDCHHTHGDCGYSEGTAEVPCGHVHNESCGYAEAVAGTPCANAETDPECDHSGDCGYVAAVEGQPCGHTEHTDCGYAPATEGTPCTHTHAVKVDSADSCYKLLCSHKDGGHDDACGYVAAVEAHECHYECAECVAALTADETTEPSTEPAPVCDCGTDDESVHATTCAVYVAPETAVCYCAEKCSDTNVWCDVCGFDYTQCGGTDAAAAYAEGAVASVTVGGTTTSYDTFDAAITAVQSCTADDEAVLTLLKEIPLGDTYQKIEGGVFTLDLNGKLLSNTDTYGWEALQVGGGAQLTIIDSGTGGTIQSATGAAVRISEGDLIVKSGTLTGRSGVSVTSDCSATINGGNIHGTEYGIYCSGTVRVYGGTVTSDKRTVYVNSGSVTINSGDFTGSHNAVYIGSNGSVTINGGSFTGGSSDFSGYGSVSMTGATFPGGITLSIITLNAALADGQAYWTGDTMLAPADGATEITDKGDITVKAACTHDSGSKSYTDNGDNHTYTYSCCNLTVTEAHTYTDGTCTGCGKVCPHTGGTATCTQKAVCTICGAEYGDLVAHSYGDWESNGDGTHSRTCTICSTATEKGNCSGGTATCTEQAKCEVCGVSYGDVAHSFDETTGFCTVCGGYQPAVDSNSDGYYEISNAGQLFWFAAVVNGGYGGVAQNDSANAVLTENITVNENVLKADGTLNGDGSTFRAWTPIGTFTNNYTGTFDGNNKTVSGLYFNDSATINVGLFGYVGSDGKVQNVGVVDSYLNGNEYVGGVIGNLDYGTVQNCYNTGTVSGSAHVGGVLGNMYKGTVQSCYNTGTVSGQSYVGGVVGYHYNGTITNCYYLSGTAAGGIDSSDVTGSAEAKTAAQFASGEVAYLLNGDQSTIVFKQTLGTDDYPNFTGAKVYSGYDSCAETATAIYTNDSTVPAEKPAHSGGEATCQKQAVCEICGTSYGAVDTTNHDSSVAFNDNGFCPNCDEYEPATLIEDTESAYNGYYEIGNAGQLFWFAEQINSGAIANTSNAVLTADIDLENRAWTPIGRHSDKDSSINLHYSGTFDGQNHVIKNLSVLVTTTCEAGLFSRVESGTLQNFGIINATVENTQSVRAGVVAGEIHKSTVTNVFTAGAITVTTSNVNGQAGGIAGECASTTLTNCYTTYGMLTANNTAPTSVTNCYYLAESENTGSCGEFKTAEQFASGEVACLLQGEQTEHVWGQTIGTDSYPTLGGAKVYAGYDTCANDAAVVYTNTETPAEKVHTYVNGICEAVEGEIHYQPAELVDGIYKIGNAGQLVWFAQQINSGAIAKNANAILIDNIDMDGIDWTPICSTGLYYNTTTYTDKGYEGTFDGGGYTISNLKITGTDGVKASYGLFGTLSGTVKNLGMSGMTFSYADTYDTNTTDARAGAIAGQMLDGSLISDCFVVDSSLTPNNYIVGGIAGCNYAGTIQNCYTKNVTISAHDRCGNLVSDTRGDISTTDRPGTVKNCYTDASRVVGTNTSGSEYITGCVANILDRFFASGEITYKLNGDRTETVWYQKDGMPAFSGSIVYENTCGGDIFYSTTDVDFDSHNIGSDYRCTNCGNYEPAILVTAENCSDLGLDSSYVGYYAIKNASNLYWYSERERIGDISGSIVLLNDITLDNSKAEWVPIVWDGDCTFDGRGNTITLKLDYGTTQRSENYGLFGTCNYSVVKNLVLDGVLTVNTTGHVGAVAGSMYRTTVSNVISYVNVTNTCTTSGSVGGLAGCFGGQHDTAKNQYSKIENSAVYANVTGYNAGGLVGEGWGGNQYWDITNAAYFGNVTTTNTTSGTAGAIVGYQNTDNYTSTFTNIYWNQENGLGFYGKRDTENQVYTNTEAKTADQFASGEVTWLLNGSTTENAVWYQTIGLHDYPVFEGATVNLNDTTYENTGNFIYVEISWTEMSFTYTGGEWNPETHAYENSGWVPDTEGGGTVTVTNKGSAVYVSLGYTSLLDGVSGSFDPANTSICLEKGESVGASLNLTGEPTGGPFTDRQIGTVTVTISQTPPAAMTATWEVGDTVEYIGKNGKAYSCYIVSESNGKYVLLTKEPEIFNTSSSSAASSELEALRKTQLEEVGAARYPTYRVDDADEYLAYESYLDEVLPQNPYGNGGCFSPMVNEDGHDRWACKSASSGNIVWAYSASGAKQGYFYYIFEVPVS